MHRRARSAGAGPPPEGGRQTVTVREHLLDAGAREFLDAFVARALYAHLGRWEYFWAPCTNSAVALGSPEEVIAKATCTLANPVAAGLFHARHLWPGLWSAPDIIGTTIRVRRPDHVLDEEGLLPAYVDLELGVPPASERQASKRRPASETNVTATRGPIGSARPLVHVAR